MDFSDRLFAPRGKPYAVLENHGDRLIVSGANKHVFSYLNQSRLTESRTASEFVSRTIPVLSMLVKEIYPEGFRIRTLADNDMMTALLNNIAKNRKNVEIFFLDLKPDEITENSPRELRATRQMSFAKRIASYQDDISRIINDIRKVIYLLEIILKTRLPETMWGTKEIQRILLNARAHLCADDAERLDFFAETTKIASEFVQRALQKEIRITDSYSNSIKAIIESFFSIKGMVRKIIQDFYDLFDIDAAFRRMVGYPATWFINSDFFCDYCSEYEEMIKNMIQCARLETDVIEPLFLWKIKTTGDKKWRTI